MQGWCARRAEELSERLPSWLDLIFVAGGFSCGRPLGLVAALGGAYAFDGADTVDERGADLVELLDGAALGEADLPILAEGEIRTPGFLAGEVNDVADCERTFAFGFGFGFDRGFAGEHFTECDPSRTFLPLDSRLEIGIKFHRLCQKRDGFGRCQVHVGGEGCDDRFPLFDGVAWSGVVGGLAGSHEAYECGGIVTREGLEMGEERAEVVVIAGGDAGLANGFQALRFAPGVEGFRIVHVAVFPLDVVSLAGCHHQGLDLGR